jgi:hypothetical protein
MRYGKEKYMCPHCMSRLKDKETLDAHKKECLREIKARINYKRLAYG